MPVTNESKAAYGAHEFSGQTLRVLQCYIKASRPLTDQTIANFLEIPPGRVSARRNNIIDACPDLLISNSHDVNEGSRTRAKAWRIKKDGEKQPEECQSGFEFKRRN